MLRSKYVGDNPLLKGKTAIVMKNLLRIKYDPPNVETAEQIVLIQADDVSTGYGYGWHELPAEDWRIE